MNISVFPGLFKSLFNFCCLINFPLFLILGSLVVLSTLTRETAILIMAFYFALNYKSILDKPAHARLNKPQKTLVFISLCFLLDLCRLRVALGYEHAIYQNIEVFNGFDIFLNAGILLVLSITLLVFINKQITKEMIAFSVAALVYILPILIVANPSQIRLWTPLILLFTIMKVRASPLPISTPEGQTIAN